MSTAAPQIRREFLGWDRPALAEATRRLTERNRDGQTLDLGNVIVVTPGKRAGRRLQELLAFIAEDEKLLLTPPEVVTEGTLPEFLYTPKFPFANDTTQELAWARALRELPAESRQHIVPRPPDAADALAWLKLGGVLRRVHIELAADGMDFAAVLECGPRMKAFSELDRWKALVALQQHYLKILDGEELWDIQTARLKAIELSEIQTDRDIVLLGTVDLNKTLRRMLDLVSERVTACIVAPESHADKFDSHGCLLTSAWCESEVPIKDDQLQQVDGPAEQAQAVSDWLARLDGKYRADQVAVGVSDESLVPHLQRELEQCGINGRWVEGARIGESAPYRLLAAAVKFAGQKRYEDLAALIRHPNVEDWLESAGCGVRSAASMDSERSTPSTEPVSYSLPAQLDLYYNKRLPSHIDAKNILANESWPDLGSACERVQAWLAEAAKKHRLRDWGAVFQRILAAIYGGQTLNRAEPACETLYAILSKIIDACAKGDSIPDALDRVNMSASDAFEIVLGPLAKEALPPPADSNAVEILGWLELPLDDSDALVVTSFNEGFVPKSVNADAFLPETLRRELGIEHNDRRYARDAYATSVLCHGRTQLRLILARRNADKEPLQPSRLVFACAEDAMVQRALRFFTPDTQPAAQRRLLVDAEHKPPERSRFEVPKPIMLEKKLERISVTRFKHYLACPYRYYLRFVQGLEAIDDAGRELDGSDFGTLIHATLGAFGRAADAPRLSEREAELFAYLSDTLTTQAKQRFGDSAQRASIRLQIEQARVRMKAFAARQVELTREGWRIVYAEQEYQADVQHQPVSVEFRVDDERVHLLGQIDRIDYHESLRCVRILDYKSADAAKHPEKTHRKGESWIDLQLPLYRHLWTELNTGVGQDCTIQLGYFNLPKRIEETKVVIAEWDDIHLGQADEAARQVIRQLLSNEFGSPVYPAPEFSEDFAAICLDNVFGGPACLDDEEEANS